MATQAVWQPKEEGLREICGLLEQHISPTSDKPRIWQQLQHFTQIPDFNNYLAFIFARAQGTSVEIRQAAGLLLKNNLRSAFKSMDPAYQQYIKSELLPCLGAADKHIRTTVGTIISVIVQQERILGWPELLQALMQCLDSNDINHMEGAMDTLSKVCSAFVQLIEVNPSSWRSAYGEAQLNPELLREFLQRLIPILLSNMVYADDDESLIDAERMTHNQTGIRLPHFCVDIRPRFHSSRFHGSDDMKDDDDDSLNVWNLRKCSAAGLDIISNIYRDEILPTLMPLVEAKLLTSDDETWKEREAAVLALGAIAEGCIEGLYPHLAEIVAYLIPVLDDKFPLLRSITCWTLSRFCKFIVQGIVNEKGTEQFNKVLMGLLRRILDTNKRVQEAACSAFATLEEEAAEVMVPYLETILQHLMCAFGDTSTLADAVGLELNKPRYLDILMPPLIAKWQQLSDSDKDLFPLLECFASIAQALGTGFSQFAGPVFQRCLNIIQSQQLAKVDPTSAGIQYDKEFVVCSLDLVSALAEALGVSQSNLRDVLLQCCVDDAPDVRQSALALLGDLARVCPVCLHPSLSNFLNIAAKQLGTPELKESISVANNACWAIGELAIKVREEVSPVSMTVISCLVPILHHAEGLNRSLVENSAITLGRLAWVCPEIVSPHMEHFMQPWCAALSMIRDGVEKEDAFRGLCAIVRLNPSGALNSLVYMCRAIASWQAIRSEDLHNEVCQVLHAYKQMLRDGSWERCLLALEPPVKDKLSKYQKTHGASRGSVVLQIISNYLI
ncbi:hypothetical protein GH714_016541 [Hevea brasiliensis]|uniref:Importin N-terminal domain-containing protein n=1 Tax=Hevea brasiliensis TaxID=3981 RepID=A0A6A6NHT9_HEVBR|nr:hypothetical protein GH714_016541 [Hevea brasiliensis]